jgi:hypothetical protein
MEPATLASSTTDTQTEDVAGSSPCPYLTPPCRVGADRWPDLHRQCRAPGYRHRILGWIPIRCACSCHAGGEKL